MNSKRLYGKLAIYKAIQINLQDILDITLHQRGGYKYYKLGRSQRLKRDDANVRNQDKKAIAAES